MTGMHGMLLTRDVLHHGKLPPNVEEGCGKGDGHRRRDGGTETIADQEEEILEMEESGNAEDALMID